MGLTYTWCYFPFDCSLLILETYLVTYISHLVRLKVFSIVLSQIIHLLCEEDFFFFVICITLQFLNVLLMD